MIFLSLARKMWLHRTATSAASRFQPSPVYIKGVDKEFNFVQGPLTFFSTHRRCVILPFVAATAKGVPF